MLSRVADALYWLHRYFERAENVARIVDVNLLHLLDLRAEEGPEWAALIRSTGDEVLFQQRYGVPTRANVLQFLTFDAQSPNSILSCLRGSRENARCVREVISSPMWEQVNKAYLWMNEAARHEELLEQPHEFYAEVRQAAHLFAGISGNTMARGEAWHFGRMGAFLERADKTSRIVDVRCHLLEGAEGDVGEAQWAALLRSTSALEMYRQAWGRIEGLDVVAFLLLDRGFPRSVRFCVSQAERSLHAITGNPMGQAETRPERALGWLRAQLELADMEEIARQGLRPYLDNLQGRLNAVGDAIHGTFFAPREAASPQGALSGSAA